MMSNAIFFAQTPHCLGFPYLTCVCNWVAISTLPRLYFVTQSYFAEFSNLNVVDTIWIFKAQRGDFLVQEGVQNRTEWSGRGDYDL